MGRGRNLIYFVVTLLVMILALVLLTPRVFKIFDRIFKGYYAREEEN